MGAQVFIRSMQTKWYLREQNEWCTDSRQARCFTSAFEADQYCKQQQFTDVELVIVRTDRPVLTIPLRSRGSAPR